MDLGLSAQCNRSALDLLFVSASLRCRRRRSSRTLLRPFVSVPSRERSRHWVVVSFPPARVLVVRFGDLRRDQARRSGQLPVVCGGEDVEVMVVCMMVVVCMVEVLKEEREGRREWFRAMTRMVGVSQSWAALYPCAEPKCEAAEKPLPRLFRCLSDG